MGEREGCGGSGDTFATFVALVVDARKLSVSSRTMGRRQRLARESSDPCLAFGESASCPPPPSSEEHHRSHSFKPQTSRWCVEQSCMLRASHG